MAKKEVQARLPDREREFWEEERCCYQTDTERNRRCKMEDS